MKFCIHFFLYLTLYLVFLQLVITPLRECFALKTPMEANAGMHAVCTFHHVISYPIFDIDFALYALYSYFYSLRVGVCVFIDFE